MQKSWIGLCMALQFAPTYESKICKGNETKRLGSSTPEVILSIDLTIHF